VVTKIIAVLFIALGIGVSLWLIRNPQVINPKAAENPLAKITEENYETRLNPFGDAWAWKKVPNRSVQIAASVPLTVFNTTTDANSNILNAQASFFSKANYEFMWMGVNLHLTSLRDRQLTQAIKAKNPNAKPFGYLVITENNVGWGEIINGANSGDATFESFLVHKKGLPPTKENRLSARPDHPEWGYSPLMDITNKTYRDWIIPRQVQALKDAGWDGVILDEFMQRILDARGLSPSIPSHILSAWPTAVTSYFKELKAALGSNMFLFANLDDDDTVSSINGYLQAGLDGAFFEDPLGTVGDEASLIKTRNLMDTVAQQKRLIMIGVSTNVNCPASTSTCLSRTNEAKERAYAKYYLAAFLALYQSTSQSLIYWYPTVLNDQYFSLSFFREWDLNLGAPLRPPESLGDGIYRHRFQNGYAYVNTSNNHYTPDESGLVSIENGLDMSTQSIPPKSGAFFVTNAVLQEYNTPPVISEASPLVSPTGVTSPSPTRKIGDIDNNGRVDIFDFNFLVGDYRGTNMRSDLNGDNKVDLFDFNLLVTNFGK
jgi:hypothetical protein